MGNQATVIQFCPSQPHSALKQHARPRGTCIESGNSYTILPLSASQCTEAACKAKGHMHRIRQQLYNFAPLSASQCTEAACKAKGHMHRIRQQLYKFCPPLSLTV